MTMNLYRVTPAPKVQLLIVAPTTTKAAEIFVAETGVGDPRQPMWIIEQLDLSLSDPFRGNLDEVLSRGVSGVARYREVGDWFVEPGG